MPLLLPAAALFAQQAPPEIPYDSVPHFLKLPADRYLGEAAGVAVNSKGHVFVLSRGNTTGPAYGAASAQLLEFAPDGKFLREIGKNLYAWSFAHAVRVDKDDNIWVIDKGSDMIVKFNPEGRVAMVFGRRKEASDEGDGPWTHVKPPRPAVDGQFRQPTDVTWDREGDIFISDGYVNSRVAKYDKNGDWVKQWGRPGSGQGEFNTPHSIAADRAGQHLCRRPRQSPDSGVRSQRRVSCGRSRSTCRRRTTRNRGWAARARPRKRPGRCSPALPGRSASRRARRSTCTARMGSQGAFIS